MRMPMRLVAGCALILMVGCGSGVPLIELYEDGTLTLDGDRIELVDLAQLAERPADAPAVRLRIRCDTPVTHVWALQTQLQESAVDNVIVIDD